MKKRRYTKAQKKKLEKFAKEGKLELENWRHFSLDFDEETLNGRSIRKACFGSLEDRSMYIGEDWDDISPDYQYVELDIGGRDKVYCWIDQAKEILGLETYDD